MQLYSRVANILNKNGIPFDIKNLSVGEGNTGSVLVPDMKFICDLQDNLVYIPHQQSLLTDLRIQRSHLAGLWINGYNIYNQ